MSNVTPSLIASLVVHVNVFYLYLLKGRVNIFHHKFQIVLIYNGKNEDLPNF